MNSSILTVETSLLYGLKLLLSSFMEPQGADQVDRFSHLPPDLVHRILSLLSLPDSAGVGCISRACREFHISNPLLNFTVKLNRVVVHCETNKIRGFSVKWVADYGEVGHNLESFYNVDKSQFMDWIRTAVRFNVESLTIVHKAEMPKYYGRNCGWVIKDELEFPSYVFTCESLRCLVVDMKCSVLQAPSFSASSISNITCLRLTNVTVEYDEWFCKWVSSCRFLKELMLKNVAGLENITIESSSLETFGLEWSSKSQYSVVCTGVNSRRNNRLRFSVRHPNSFKLSAPNLKRLKLAGKMWRILDVAELNCSDGVEISLELSYEADDHLESEHDHFFCSIRTVKVLIVDPWAIKTLFSEGFTAAPLHSVQCLRIRILHTGIYDELVPALASLFKGVPNLNALDITCNDRTIAGGMGAFAFSRRYWELQGLDVISQLQEVTLELHTGFNGIGLAWYILEHAQNLKKMIILCSPKVPHHLSFMTKLKRTRILSNAIIVFEEIAIRGL